MGGDAAAVASLPAAEYEDVMCSLELGAACDMEPTVQTPIRCAALPEGDAALEAEAIDASQVARRSQLRQGWSEHPSDAFESARNLADPLLGVSQNAIPFRNRAALKLADVDQVTRVISAASPTPATPSDEPRHELLFADLCGAPGSWTEYLLWAVHTPGFLPDECGLPDPPKANGWGFSLMSPGNALLHWQLDYFQPVAKANCPRKSDFAFTGETGDGDITSNQNLIDFMLHIREHAPDGLDVVMGDGGVIHEKDHENAETQLRRVVLGEVLAMLLTLRQGGSFVLKVLDIQSAFSISTLWVLYNEFEEVDLLKPTLSRPANSERYFVGRRRRNAPPFLTASQSPPLKIIEELAASTEGLTPLGVCRLLYAVNALEGSEAGSRLEGFIQPGSMSRPFLAWLRKRNDAHIAQQIVTSAVITAALHDPARFPKERVEALHKERAVSWWNRSDLESHRTKGKAKRQRVA